MNQKHVVIIGSGTAGLTTALTLRAWFNHYPITVISSERIGIIGVGEGSTEHWRMFQDDMRIPVEDLLVKAAATHKYGIAFEGWTSHTPHYYHSVSHGPITIGNFAGSYAYCLENNLQLTKELSWRGMNEGKIPYGEDKEGKEITHLNTNQYHFDTHKLNAFLKGLCLDRGVFFVDDEVDFIRKDEDGFVTSVYLKNRPGRVDGDFFVDASGFNRVIMKEMDDQTFVDYKPYLPCDSALVFPTPSRDDGKILPFTRARAMSAGWMWEIPTQERRGNGYVFSSSHISDDDAISEASKVSGFDVAGDNPRILRFDSGYWKQTWQKNVVSVGLSAGFVEPLEATSISVSLQQARLIASYLPTFNKTSKFMVAEYHRLMDQIMENLLTMISLHYMSDRNDTPMWKDQQSAKKPELLERLLGLWSERCPEIHDMPHSGFELFSPVHLWHVGQGQGVLDPAVASAQLDAYGSRVPAQRHIDAVKIDYMKGDTVDHAEALKRLADSQSE